MAIPDKFAVKAKVYKAKMNLITFQSIRTVIGIVY